MVVTPYIHEIGSEGVAPGRTVRLSMEIPKELAYFEGHFPGTPLLPGVVQLNWAVDYARQYLQVEGAFQAVTALKFKRVIQPGDSVTLYLEYEGSERQLRFEYRTQGELCSGGAVSFAAPAGADSR